MVGLVGRSIGKKSINNIAFLLAVFGRSWKLNPHAALRFYLSSAKELEKKKEEPYGCLAKVCLVLEMVSVDDGRRRFRALTGFNQWRCEEW
ncbi:hypothetical protein CEXT_107521 [Caerostris extrusa]|uniref:Uncharacterized protein n=1 Tax=Caerostris extrusa TaxID=172846 RepID=A0AAV4VSY1_CAEEX|nr:hypothetical protein CEXT_107521 [Caerostris extrusa]